MNYRVQDGRSQGRIYDPGFGNTYSSVMKVDRKGEIPLRGYIGIAVLRRTRAYRSFDPCSGYDLAVGKEFASGAECVSDAVPSERLICSAQIEMWRFATNLAAYRVIADRLEIGFVQ